MTTPDPREFGFPAYGVDLCPVCGAEVCIAGRMNDGRLIGSCGDTFTVADWNDQGAE